MSGVNKVILVGNAGKDPEVKYLEGGAAVAKFSLATSDSYKDKTTGEKVEQTEWHNIVMWNKLAEIAEKYVKKGNKLYIEGKIRNRSYGEENNKKYITEIIADNMVMLGSGRRDDPGFPSPPPNVGSRVAENAEVPLPAATSAPTDDLPF